MKTIKTKKMIEVEVETVAYYLDELSREAIAVAIEQAKSDSIIINDFALIAESNCRPIINKIAEAFKCKIDYEVDCPQARWILKEVGPKTDFSGIAGMADCYLDSDYYDRFIGCLRDMVETVLDDWYQQAHDYEDSAIMEQYLVDHDVLFDKSGNLLKL